MERNQCSMNASHIQLRQRCRISPASNTIARSHAMPDLLIRLKRASDGSAALTCVRADGSVTWQRQTGARGQVFPAHDLTHYAVETVLGYRHGFYGLIADGWAIDDFAPPWPRGRIPVQAREAELIVGVFDMQRLTGPHWTAAELREEGARYASTSSAARDGVTLPLLTDDDVARVRAARADVFARWDATFSGNTLELTFVRSSFPERGA